MLLIRFLPNCFTELRLSLRYFVYFAQIIRFIKIPTFTRFTSLPIFFLSQVYNFFPSQNQFWSNIFCESINWTLFSQKIRKKWILIESWFFCNEFFFLFLMRFTLRYFTLQIILVAKKKCEKFQLFFSFDKTHTENLHQYELNSINIWHLYSILAGELNKRKSNERANVS